MAQQIINTGAANDDGTGDVLRAAFNKVKANFTELYSLTGVNANNLGIFTGTLIPDNSTIKVALQTLETALNTTGATSTVVANFAGVATIPTPTSGDISWALDASGDPSITSGGALYLYDGGAWVLAGGTGSNSVVSNLADGLMPMIPAGLIGSTPIVNNAGTGFDYKYSTTGITFIDFPIPGLPAIDITSVFNTRAVNSPVLYSIGTNTVDFTTTDNTLYVIEGGVQTHPVTYSAPTGHILAIYIDGSNDKFIQVLSSSSSSPDASTTVKGIQENATDAEAQAITATDKTVTPSNLLSMIASPGSVTLGSAGDRFVTPFVVANEARDAKTDVAGFAAPGAENAVGINNTDNTIQKVLDKVEDYAGNSLTKAVGADILGGTDDVKYVTSKAILDNKSGQLHLNLGTANKYPDANDVRQFLINSEAIPGDITSGAGTNGVYTSPQNVKDEAVHSTTIVTGFAAPGAENTLGINNTDNTIQKVLDRVENYVASTAITGQLVGSNVNFGSLPLVDALGDAVSNGDWALLLSDNVGSGTVIAPQYPRGIYVYDGAAYIFTFEVEDSFTSAKTNFINRNATTTQNVAPTAGEHPVTAAEDTAVIFLQDNIIEYWTRNATNTTWLRDIIIDPSVVPFLGTVGPLDGLQGLVPSPVVADQEKFLNADGTWQHAGGLSYTSVVSANHGVSSTSLTNHKLGTAYDTSGPINLTHTILTSAFVEGDEIEVSNKGGGTVNVLTSATATFDGASSYLIDFDGTVRFRMDATGNAWEVVSKTDFSTEVDDKYIEVTTDGQVLESGKKYYSAANGIVTPISPAVGDWFEIHNTAKVNDGGRILLTANTGTNLQGPNTSQLLPAFLIAPAQDFRFVFDGTNWNVISHAESSTTLLDANSGVKLRGAMYYLFNSTAASNSVNLPAFPIGTFRIRLDALSTQPLLIEQDNTGAAAQLRLEDGTLVTSFNVPEVQKSKYIEIVGDPATQTYNVYREWKQTSLDAAITLTDAALVTWNADDANRATLDTNLKEITIDNPTNLRVGQLYSLKITNSNNSGIYDGVKVNFGNLFKDIPSTGDTSTYVRSESTYHFVSPDGLQMQFLSLVPKKAVIAHALNSANSNITHHSEAFSYSSNDGTPLAVDNPVSFSTIAYDNQVINIHLANTGTVVWPVNFDTEFFSRNGISAFTIDPIAVGSSVTHSFIADKVNGGGRIWREVHSRVDNAEILPDLPLGVAVADGKYVAIAPAGTATEITNNRYIVQISNSSTTPAVLDPVYWDGADLTVLSDYNKTGSIFRHSSAGIYGFAPADLEGDEIELHIIPSGITKQFWFLDNPAFITVYDDFTTGQVTYVDDAGKRDMTIVGPAELKFTKLGNGGRITISPGEVAKDHLFMGATALGAALVALPILAEVQAYVTANNIKDQFVYYTGTDVDTNARTHVYTTDKSGSVELLFETATRVGEIAADQVGRIIPMSPLNEVGATMTQAAFEAKGLLQLKSGNAIVGGVATYPKVAAMYPWLIAGPNLVVPANMNGTFFRNLGGNAAAFGTAQGDDIQSHEHDFRAWLSTNSGGAFIGPAANVDNSFTPTTIVTGGNGGVQATGGTETRPNNYAVQYCIILDNYASSVFVDTAVVPLGTIATPNVSEYASTQDISDEFDKISDLQRPAVADVSALIAVAALEEYSILRKDTEQRYIFKLTADLTVGEDADVNNIASGGGTGKWILQTVAGISTVVINNFHEKTIGATTFTPTVTGNYNVTFSGLVNFASSAVVNAGVTIGTAALGTNILNAPTAVTIGNVGAANGKPTNEHTTSVALVAGTQYFITNIVSSQALDSMTTHIIYDDQISTIPNDSAVVIDDDSFATASAINVASAESTKAYVDSKHASTFLIAEALISPAIATEATDAEIITYLNGEALVLDRHCIYTGTNTSTDSAKSVWFKDSAGLVTKVEGEGGASEELHYFGAVTSSTGGTGFSTSNSIVGYPSSTSTNYTTDTTITANVGGMLEDDTHLLIKNSGLYKLSASLHNAASSQTRFYVDGVGQYVPQGETGINNFELLIDLTAGQRVWVQYNNSGSSIQFQYFTVQQLPTHTVTMPDTTTVDDQSTSGYMDIGDMRMQWGKINDGNNDGAFNVPFVAPFADANYSVVVTSGTSNNGYAAATTGHTVNFFQLDRSNDANSTIVWHWQAIGLKP